MNMATNNNFKVDLDDELFTAQLMKQFKKALTDHINEIKQNPELLDDCGCDKKKK